MEKTDIPPAFEEQAQELVLKWKAQDFISSLNMREDRLIEAVSSFAFEAASRALHQAAQVAAGHFYGDCTEDTCAKSIEKDIRALQPLLTPKPIYVEKSNAGS